MEWWLILIIVFLAVDFLLVAWVFVKKLRNKKFDQKELNYIHSHWVRIIDSFGAHPTNAILDADKLLDYALGRKGFQGSLGDKLKKAKFRFSDINGVWRAHKLRNQIAHELGEIDKEEAKNALKNFKKALNDLGACL